MKKIVASFILCLTVGCLAHWPAEDATYLTESEKLKQISNNFWQYTLEDSPVWATFIGNREYDDKLPDLSLEAKQKKIKTYGAFLSSVQLLDRNQLTTEEKLTADVLYHELRSEIDVAQCRDWLWTVDQLSGPQVNFAELPNHHSISSLKDAQTLITRYQKMKYFYEQLVDNLRIGSKQGYVPAKINVELVVKQLNRQLETAPEKSPYFEVVQHLPTTLTHEQKEQIKKDLLLSINAYVYPGLLLYRNFLKDELLAKSRANASVSSIPKGSDCYHALIRKYTGLELSAEEIHQLGIREITRIKSEMKELLRSKNINIPLDAYTQFMKQKNKLNPPSRNELLSHNQKLISKAQATLPRAFTQIPKTPIEVKSIESFREQEAPAAYYYEAPRDSSRAAFYYLNTYKPEERLLPNMAAWHFMKHFQGIIYRLPWRMKTNRCQNSSSN